MLSSILLLLASLCILRDSLASSQPAPVVAKFTVEEVTWMGMPFLGQYWCEQQPSQSECPSCKMDNMLQYFKDYKVPQDGDPAVLITAWLNKIVDAINSQDNLQFVNVPFLLIPIFARASESEFDVAWERLLPHKNEEFRKKHKMMFLYLKGLFLCGDYSLKFDLDHNSEIAVGFIWERIKNYVKDESIMAFLDAIAASKNGRFDHFARTALNVSLPTEVYFRSAEMKEWGLPFNHSTLKSSIFIQNRLEAALLNAIVNMIVGENGWSSVKQSLWMTELIRNHVDLASAELAAKWFNGLKAFADSPCEDSDRQIVVAALFSVPFLVRASEEECVTFFDNLQLVHGDKVKAVTYAMLRLFRNGSWTSRLYNFVDLKDKHTVEITRQYYLKNIFDQPTPLADRLGKYHLPVKKFLEKVIGDENSEPELVSKQDERKTHKSKVIVEQDAHVQHMKTPKASAASSADKLIAPYFTRNEVEEMGMPFQNAYFCKIMPEASPRVILNRMLQTVLKKGEVLPKGNDPVDLVLQWLNEHVIKGTRLDDRETLIAATFKLVPIIAQATQDQFDKLLRRLGFCDYSSSNESFNRIEYYHLLVHLKNRLICRFVDDRDKYEDPTLFKVESSKANVDTQIKKFLAAIIPNQVTVFNNRVESTLASFKLPEKSHFNPVIMKSFGFPFNEAPLKKPKLFRQRLRGRLLNIMIHMILGQNGWGSAREILMLNKLIQEHENYDILDLASRWFSALKTFADVDRKNAIRSIVTALFMVPFIARAGRNELMSFLRYFLAPGDCLDVRAMLSVMLQFFRADDETKKFSEYTDHHLWFHPQVVELFSNKLTLMAQMEKYSPVTKFLERLIPDRPPSAPESLREDTRLTHPRAPESPKIPHPIPAPEPKQHQPPLVEEVEGKVSSQEMAEQSIRKPFSSNVSDLFSSEDNSESTESEMEASAQTTTPLAHGKQKPAQQEETQKPTTTFRSKSSSDEKTAGKKHEQRSEEKAAQRKSKSVAGKELARHNHGREDSSRKGSGKSSKETSGSGKMSKEGSTHLRRSISSAETKRTKHEGRSNVEAPHSRSKSNAKQKLAKHKSEHKKRHK